MYTKKSEINRCALSAGPLDFLDSIVVSIPACHAGDRGSIPRRGEESFFAFAPFFSPLHTATNRLKTREVLNAHVKHVFRIKCSLTSLLNGCKL